MLVAAHRELRAYHLHDIIRSLTSLSTGRVLAALALTLLGHLVHVGYDLLALRYAGHPVPLRRIAFGSLVTYSVSAVTGFTGVVGASLRYRFWSAWGVPTGRIAEAVGFAAFTAGLGATTAAGVALALQPAALSLSRDCPSAASRDRAGAGRGRGGLSRRLCSRAPALHLRGVAVRLPRPGLALAQVTVAALDWAIAGSVFFVVLPGIGLSFMAFLSMFLAAQVGGVVAHVPAGIGVFDAVILLLLRPFAHAPTAVAGLLAYRAIAYLLPALAATRCRRLRDRPAARAPAQAVRGARRWLEAVVPSVLSAAAFLAGCVLLASGATPGVPSRLAWLGNVVPLGVIETAHFLGSLAGVGLLILARGLHRRLDVAYHLTVLALMLGIGASLLKGGDFEEALVLGAVLALVLPARARFYRRTALLSGPWSPGWLIAMALALGATTWLGLFSYRHVAYSHDLWWQFTLDGDAPRWLRASVGGAVLVAVAALWHLLGPSPVRTPVASDEDIERAAASPTKAAWRDSTSRSGDKSLLFGSGGGALMYAVSGRSWIGLGDPVGAPEDRSELVWRLKELADRHGGRLVFYEIGPDNLPLYVDLGLRMIKIGEEGRVPLATWSLEGSARSLQRRMLRHVERANCTFEIVPPRKSLRFWPSSGASRMPGWPPSTPGKRASPSGPSTSRTSAASRSPSCEARADRRVRQSLAQRDPSGDLARSDAL